MADARPFGSSCSLTLHIGASGMGKTYATARVAEAYARRGWTCLVVDAKGEWPRQSRTGVLVSGAKGADKVRASGGRTIVWCDGPGGIDIDSACQWAIDNGPGVLIAVPEAHMHWPNGPRPGEPSRIVLTGYRHAGLSVILDTQRLVSLSTMARNNLDLARVFGVVGPRDIDELRAWGGDELEAAARECARRRRPPTEQRGWFVPFDPANAGGPYRLERFGGGH